MNPDDEKSRRVSTVLGELATKYETAADTTAYAWLLSHPAKVVPIVGSGNLDRIRSATDALHISLELQDWFKIYSSSTGEEVP